MNFRSKGMAITISSHLLGAAFVMVMSAPVCLAQEAAAAGAPQTAAQKYKNIQVLKDIPAEELVPSMQFISASLGVECDYCHVRDAFDKDDKEKKKIARKMITMMMAINKDNFNGKQEVTCNSCHHGSAHPDAVPAVADANFKPEMRGPRAPGMNGEAAPPALPSPDQVMEKYIQAVGGADALLKITSRVEKGTIGGFGPEGAPVDVYAKAPDKRITVMHTPRGESYTAFDGKVGWLSGFRGPREVNGGELDAMKLHSDFYLPTHLKEDFSQFRPRPGVKIDGKDTNLIFGLSQGHPPVALYFDAQSGLLVRMITYVQTPLGRIPAQEDYTDYREVDGVKIPYQWTISRPGGRFTIQVNEVHQDVPVDDSKFTMPPAPVEKPPSR